MILNVEFVGTTKPLPSIDSLGRGYSGSSTGHFATWTLLLPSGFTSVDSRKFSRDLLDAWRCRHNRMGAYPFSILATHQLVTFVADKVEDSYGYS
jgi:hypothetical protein